MVLIKTPPRPNRSWWNTILNGNSPSAPSAPSATLAPSASSAQQQVTSDADLDAPITDSDLKKSLYYYNPTKVVLKRIYII
jgi:hypothetical protein